MLIRVGSERLLGLLASLGVEGGEEKLRDVRHGGERCSTLRARRDLEFDAFAACSTRASSSCGFDATRRVVQLGTDHRLVDCNLQRRQAGSSSSAQV